jgi:hypothetical protein
LEVILRILSVGVDEVDYHKISQRY